MGIIPDYQVKKLIVNQTFKKVEKKLNFVIDILF